MRKRILTTAALTALLASTSFGAVKKIEPGIDGATFFDEGGEDNSVTVTTITGVPGSTDYVVLDLSSDSDGMVTLNADNEWLLGNIVLVTNGTLAIEAGTILRGEMRSANAENDAGALVITRTARIDAQGTPANPIIFTTGALDNDGDDVPDGVVVTANNPDGDDFFFTKSGDQWTDESDVFLDADPKNNPLPFIAADEVVDAVAGVPPAVFVDSNGNGNPDEYVETVSENRSLWGGVIILGNAPTSIAEIRAGAAAASDTSKGDIGDTGPGTGILDDIFEGFIEGLNIEPLQELGVYGGKNPADSSGVFAYVSIRHGGQSIVSQGADNASANEINGLTMGGVGSGTKIEYVEVYCNGDDGYEWFGGTVDTKFLISLWNNDDSFDIDEGFTGLGQFWFSLQGDDTINGDHGGEHDGTDAVYESIDVNDGGGFGTGDSGLGLVPTFPTIYNATYIGGGEHGNVTTDSGANRALRVRDSFNGIYRNSIFAEFKDTPVRDNDGDNVGELTLEGNVFWGVDAGYADANAVFATGSAPAGFLAESGNVIDEDVFAVRKLGAGTFTEAKFDRRGHFNTGVNSVGFDPRPDVSAAPSVTSDLAYVLPTFFTATAFKGAFPPSATAETIWTGADGSVGNPAWSVFGKAFLDLQ